MAPRLSAPLARKAWSGSRWDRSKRRLALVRAGHARSPHHTPLPATLQQHSTTTRHAALAGGMPLQVGESWRGGNRFPGGRWTPHKNGVAHACAPSSIICCRVSCRVCCSVVAVLGPAGARFPLVHSALAPETLPSPKSGMIRFCRRRGAMVLPATRLEGRSCGTGPLCILGLRRQLQGYSGRRASWWEK